MSNENAAPIQAPAKVGFIGMGSMGGGMAINLAKKGFAVKAFDTSSAARERFERETGTACVGSAGEAFTDVEAVVLMLGDGKVVRKVLMGTEAQPAIAAATRGTLVIDCSSSAPPDTQALGRDLQALGLGLVDAPVSGAVKGANEGTLTLMVGGDDPLVRRADAILHAMGSSIFHTGPLGSGHAMKTINNFIAASGLIAAIEGILVGKRYGLDPDKMIDILNVSYGRNTATEWVIRQQILSGNHAANFAMWLAAKDARIMAETAEHVGYAAAQPREVFEIFEAARGKLGDNTDFTRVVEELDTLWRAGAKA